jgi:hypothetical protein
MNWGKAQVSHEYKHLNGHVFHDREAEWSAPGRDLMKFAALAAPELLIVDSSTLGA